MLTAYDAYKLAHQSLFSASTIEQILDLSRDTVENYLENRRIWDELNYFKENGTILGQHPIFHWVKRLDDIRRMKTADLVTMKIRLTHNLVCKRSALRQSPNHPATSKRKDRIRVIELELTEVNRLLNL